MKKLTIKEIAKIANVSPTAVSFVINNKKGVSNETREKVKEVIEMTNFKPNLNSKRLILKKSFNICIAINNTSSPFNDLFYLEIAKGLLEKSKEYGYNIIFTDISVSNGEVILSETVKNNDTDGIVFFQDTEEIILNKLDKLKIPYVIADAHSSDISTNKEKNNDNKDKSEQDELTDNIEQDKTVKYINPTSVSADYYKASMTAVKYLVDNGHKNIAYLSSSYIPNFYLRTFEGYKNVLEQASISIKPSWIEINAVDEQTAYECMERILRCNKKPTAVFCTTDMFAVAAVKCAKDHGYKVPEDISFCSIDDIILSNYIEPNLTTVRIDKFKIGSLAMELIAKKIDGLEPDSVVVKSDNLIIRESVTKIN